MDPALGARDQCLDPVKLHRVDNGTHVDALVQRVADAKLVHAGLEARMESVGKALLNQQTGARATHLPLIEPDRIDQSLDRAVDIGILEHDERRFAAQFKGEGDAASRSRRADLAPDLGGTGKGDLVHIRCRDHLAHSAVSGHDVDHPVGQARLTTDIREQQRRERCPFGGLQNDGIARGQRRRDLPRQHHQREIPRHDLPADAKRLPVRKFGGHQLRHPGVIVEMPLGKGDVDVAAFPDRLAVIKGFEHGEQPRMFLQQPRNGVEEPCPARPTQRLPSRLRCPCGGNGRVDIGLRRLRERGQNFARGRIAAVKTCSRIGEGAADEMAEARALIDDPCQRVPGAFGGGAILHGLEDLLDGHSGLPAAALDVCLVNFRSGASLRRGAPHAAPLTP